MNAARHSRTASWAPTKRRVLAGAGAASMAMFVVAGVGIARAHSTVNLEVDGIVYPVSTWSHTVSGVLAKRISSSVSTTKSSLLSRNTLQTDRPSSCARRSPTL